MKLKVGFVEISVPNESKYQFQVVTSEDDASVKLINGLLTSVIIGDAVKLAVGLPESIITIGPRESTHPTESITVIE